jgi:hypothetical protein
MTRLSLNSKIKNPLSTLWGERARVRGEYEKNQRGLPARHRPPEADSGEAGGSPPDRCLVSNCLLSACP